MSPRAIQQTWEAGPFRAMRFDQAAQQVEPGDYYYAYGLIPRQGRLERQFGFFVSSTGAAFSATPQGLGVFETGAGSRQVAVISGELYLQNTGGSAWSKAVTTANLTTAGITLAASGHVYMVQYGTTMVFNDGTNRPFTWDGTTGAGGLVSLTNAPSKCFGKPGVYYGKLFLIKDVAAGGADRDTLVWSEENAANTGYEAGGFNNAWRLTQTRQGALVAILGTNSGLYYFRDTSIGLIRGAVTADFTASGVHDDVAQAHGTLSPHGPILAGDYVWFTDARSRPCRFAVGSAQVEPIWQDIVDAYGQTANIDASYTQLAPVPIYSAVAVAFLTSGIPPNARPDRVFLFDVSSGRALMEWDTYPSNLDDVWYLAATAGWSGAAGRAGGLCQLSKRLSDNVVSVATPPPSNAGNYTDQPVVPSPPNFTHTGIAWFWPLLGPSGARVQAREMAIEVFCGDATLSPGWRLRTLRGYFSINQTGSTALTAQSQPTASPGQSRARLPWGVNVEGRIISVAAEVSTFVNAAMALERFEAQGQVALAAPIVATT